MKPLMMPIKCVYCRETFLLIVWEEDYNKWKDGELIQYAFPYLKSGDRELLISGHCGSCFDSLFGEENDDCDDTKCFCGQRH